MTDPTQQGRPAFVSAASGLVIKKDKFFVVADDELSMASFSLLNSDPGQFYPLFRGELPLEKKERKKEKPDLESLCLIEDPAFPAGALLALPSGSKPNRTLGALIALSSDLNPQKVIPVDLSDLYKSLPFQELNLEGAFLQNDKLILLQRENSKFKENAVLVFDWALFFNEIHQKGKVSKDSLQSIHHVDLGPYKGSELSFTDACPFHLDHFLFLASTEETDNPYDDGPFNGAVLGLMNPKLEIQWQLPLEVSAKPEGIYWWKDKSPNTILIVTDSDEASEPACLYEVTLY